MGLDGEYLTQEKFDEFTKELKHLRTVRRREVAQSLEYAKSLGDLSENAEYNEARETQAALEDRIHRLEILLRSARILSARRGETVGIGSTVILKKEKDRQVVRYILVGSAEADVGGGKLSIQSDRKSVV